jgi:hypothetical protein
MRLVNLVSSDTALFEKSRGAVLARNSGSSFAWPGGILVIDLLALILCLRQFGTMMAMWVALFRLEFSRRSCGCDMQLAVAFG